MKKTNGWAHIGLINIVLGAAFIIWGVAAPGFEHKTFDYWIALPLALGMTCQILMIFLEWKWLPLLITICYATGLGLTVYHAAPIVMDMINHINFLDGNWTTVRAQLVLLGVMLVISVLISFLSGGRKEGPLNATL